MARNEGRAARRKAEWRSSRSGRKRELERAPCEREGGRESETKRWRERLGNGVKSARDGGRRRREGEGCNSSREPVDTGTSVQDATRQPVLRVRRYARDPPLSLSPSFPLLQPRLSHPSHPSLRVQEGGKNESWREKQGVLARRSRGSAILRGSRSPFPSNVDFSRYDLR